MHKKCFFQYSVDALLIFYAQYFLIVLLKQKPLLQNHNI